MTYIRRIREKTPLVYNIMNEVGANFVANGLIAIGASPSIASNPKEAKEMARDADAVVLNLGTLTEKRAEAMMLAGKAANEAGVPVILDPIAIGATEYRTSVIHDILSTVKLTAICANVGEIAVLGEALSKTDSPDSALEENDPVIAKDVAKKYETIVIATGKQDVITDGSEVTICRNGHPMLQNITTSGCLLTSVAAAFVGVAGNDVYGASVEASAGYGIAAELAMQKASGPGMFIPTFLDQLYFLNERTIETDEQLEVV